MSAINSFWVYEPKPSWFHLRIPDDATRAEIGQAVRLAFKEEKLKLNHTFHGLYEDLKGVAGKARIGDLKLH